MTEDLDRLIASVAREMTAARPASPLRARVVARLDERRAWPWRWVLGTSVAAAAVLTMLVVVRAPDKARSTPAVPQSEASGATPREAAALDETLTPSHAVQRTSAKHRAPGTAVEPSAEELDWLARAIPALPALAALTLSSIQPEPLEIRPLITTPLSVPAIGEDESQR